MRLIFQLVSLWGIARNSSTLVSKMGTYRPSRKHKFVFSLVLVLVIFGWHGINPLAAE